MKNKFKVIDELPEWEANGDEVSSEEMGEIFEKTLSDAWTLVGMYGYNKDELNMEEIVEEHRPALKLITPDNDGEWYYQYGFVFAAKSKFHQEIGNVIVQLEEMGRYPKSESNEDDFMVSFSYTIYKDKDYLILEYYFDDSTR